MTRSVGLAVIGLAAGMLVGGAPAAASAHVAAKSPVAVDYSGPAIPITTTTHKKLELRLTVHQDSAGKSRPSILGISVKTPNHVEQHEWSFELRPGSLAIKTTKGSGKVIAGGSQLGSFGDVALSFKPVGKPTTEHCGGSRTVVTHRVLVSGSVLFATHSTGANSWGSVRIGTSHKPHQFAGRGHIDVTSGTGSCDTPASKDSCATGVGWSISGTDELIGGEGLVVHGSENGKIIVERETKLTAPSNAYRIDEMSVPSPPPALSVLGGRPTLVITTDGHGASGSAVMSSPTSRTATSETCARTHDEAFSDWVDASLTNGDTPLVLHEQIEGALAIANQTANGFIEQFQQTD